MFSDNIWMKNASFQQDAQTCRFDGANNYEQNTIFQGEINFVKYLESIMKTLHMNREI